MSIVNKFVLLCATMRSGSAAYETLQEVSKHKKRHMTRQDKTKQAFQEQVYPQNSHGGLNFPLDNISSPVKNK